MFRQPRRRSWQCGALGVSGLIEEVVVIGAGIAGLSTALGLARSGRRVIIVDRDTPPPTSDPEEAFAQWERQTVPQARQPHAFLARSRNLLLEHVPDVVDRLEAWGICGANLLDLAPQDLRVPEDDQFIGLRARRLPFERIFRQVVDEQPEIDLAHSEVVEDLEFGSAAPDQSALVTGVRLRSGRSIRADVVIDAGGRRTPVPKLLADRGVHVPVEEQDCNMTYYGRYFRQHKHSDLDSAMLSRHGGVIDLGYLSYAPFPADHGTFGAFINPPSWDKDFRSLRHNRVWEAVASSLRELAPWLDTAHAVPITDVQAMAGHKNVLRRYVTNGTPSVRGVLAVGDAICTTNPMFGWGASLALTWAFAAVEAIAAYGDDLSALSIAYHNAVKDEAEAHYRASAAEDRIRTYRWRDEDIPDDEREEAERQDLLTNGLLPGTLRDMDILRAVLRRGMLIEPPDAIWSNHEVIAKAKEIAAWRAVNRPPSSLGPSRDEMLSIMAEAEADRSDVDT